MISETWKRIISDMKKTMPEHEILMDLCYDRGFFMENGLDYCDPPIKKLKEYIGKA